jgi:hypothetical protein
VISLSNGVSPNLILLNAITPSSTYNYNWVQTPATFVVPGSQLASNLVYAMTDVTGELCTLSTDNSIRCSTAYNSGTVTYTAAGYTAFSISRKILCGITTGATLFCGPSFGTLVQYSTPASLSKLSISGNVICAISTIGDLYCATNLVTDVIVPLTWELVMKGVSSVSVNSQRICVVTSNQYVQCAMDVYNPVWFPLNMQFQMVSLSGIYICGITATLELHCTSELQTQINNYSTTTTFGRLVFSDIFRADIAHAGNNDDPYYLEKVTDGWNKSYLKLTINDDPDESLQIWGDSCSLNACEGPGEQKHAFDAQGVAYFKTAMCIGQTCVTEDQLKRIIDLL